MKQKNNQKNFLPFKIASFSIFAFFIIYILFGLDGWGSKATNENAIGEISRWCERVSGGLLREPSNTLGNLGFIFVGLYMFYKLSQDATSDKGISMFGSPSIAMIYAAASTFLGQVLLQNSYELRVAAGLIIIILSLHIIGIINIKFLNYVKNNEIKDGMIQKIQNSLEAIRLSLIHI